MRAGERKDMHLWPEHVITHVQDEKKQDWRKEFVARVRYALDALDLTPRQRKLAELHWWLGESAAAIGKRQGTTQSNITKQLRRMLTQLHPACARVLRHWPQRKEC